VSSGSGRAGAPFERAGTSAAAVTYGYWSGLQSDGSCSAPRRSRSAMLAEGDLLELGHEEHGAEVVLVGAEGLPPALAARGTDQTPRL